MTALATRIALGSLALLVAIPPAGQAATPPAAQGWTVDKAKSRLGFSAAMNGQTFNGQFRRWDAQIRFDPAHLDISGARVSIDTGSAATGDQTRDEALPTADWFSVSVFPRASFTSRRFISLGGGRYRADGDLKIRDVTRPVSFPFELRFQGNTAAMTGRLSIDRTVFGVGQGQFKGTETVAAKVDVTISITASKAS
jgi:polyisoprenoid-binding protein YceI